jgi:RNA polymerase sigma-70 factor, ECF subfamily
MLVDFHSLYTRHAPEVFRFALYLSGDAALADDITREAFVRAWVLPGEIRGGTVKAYLLMIARHLYQAEGRRAARCVALPDTLPDRNPGPKAVAGGRAELAAVLDALQALPEVDRATLLMHAQDDMPHAEIAVALGLSVAAVKAKVHRARIRRKRLREPEGEQA